jgi:hypothetical protein
LRLKLEWKLIYSCLSIKSNNILSLPIAEESANWCESHEENDENGLQEARTFVINAIEIDHVVQNA